MPWSPSVWPAIKLIDQPGSHWIFTNVNPCRLEIRLTANPVVKVVALPDDSELLRGVALPIFDEVHHSVAGIPAEGHQGMKMIGHDHGKIHLPTVTLMIEFHRIEKPLCDGIVGELIRATFLAVDRDKESRGRGHPLGRAMELPSRTS